MARRLVTLIAVLSAVLLAACAAPATPTPVPPTPVPPTAVPPTTAPTAVPATKAPTAAPATTAPTAAPPTAVPPTATSAPKSLASLGQVRIIGNGAVDFSSVDVAYFQEQLKKQGMNLDFKWVDSPDTALRSIIAGAADAYVGSLPSAILAVKNAKANVKIIAVNNQATDYVLIAKPEINSVQDLKGKTIGISTPGSAADTIIRTALKMKGFDPATAQFVTIGGTSARLTAMLSGKTDAAPLHAAESGSAVTTGKAKVVLVAGESIGVYLQSGLVASGDWIKKNPEAVQAVVDGFVDSSRWAATNKSAYIAYSKQLLPKLSDDERENAYGLYMSSKFWPVNGGLGQEGINQLLKLEQESGGLPKDLPPQSEWLDDSFVKNYIKTHPVMQGN